MGIFNREIWILLFIMVLISSSILDMVMAKKTQSELFYRIGIYGLLPFYGASFIFGVIAALMPISVNQLWFREIYLIQTVVLILATILYMMLERMVMTKVIVEEEI